jgi:hypothetical protein
LEVSPTTVASSPALAFVKWFALSGAGLFFVGCRGPTAGQPGIARIYRASHVDGYRFTAGQATLSPTLALEIRELIMMQIDHQDPPVAEIP